MAFHKVLFWTPYIVFLMLINDIKICANQYKYTDYTDDSALPICIPDNNIMDAAELIKNVLK